MMTILRYAITLTTLALLLPTAVSSQVLDYAQQTPFAPFNGADNPLLAIDGDENVFVAGRLPEGIPIDFDMSDGVDEVLFDNEYSGSGGAAFLAKYDTDGVYQWAFGLSLDGTARRIDVNGIAADADGNVTIVGDLEVRAVDDTYILIDFDPGPGFTGLGNLGNQNPDEGGEESNFVASYDADGNFRWAFELISANEVEGVGTFFTKGAGLTDVAADPDGNVYIGGDVRGLFDLGPIVDPRPVEMDPLGGGSELALSGGLLAKYSPNGTLVWATALPPGATDEGAVAQVSLQRIAVDAGGQVYGSGVSQFGPVDVAGIEVGSDADFDGVFLARFSADGASAPWAFALADIPENTAEFIHSDLKLAPSGGFFWTGYFRGVVDFDPGDGDATRTALMYPTGSSRDDAFAAYYDVDGSYVWVRQISGVYNREVLNYYADATAEGRTFITGDASPAEQIEPPDGPLVGNGDAVETLLIEYTLAEGALQNLYVIEDPPPNDNRSRVDTYGMEIAPSGKLYLLGLVTTLSNEIPFDFDFGPGETTLPIEERGLFLARYDATMRPVAGEDGPATAAAFALSRPYPNPARRARVTLALNAAQPVHVALFDVLGRRVRTLHDGPLTAGEHDVTIDGTRLPSGVYFVRATGEGVSRTVPVTLLR